MALLFFAQTSATGALIALLVIVGGFILGSLAAALARRIATRSGSEHITTAASAIATLVFSLILIAALIAALGIINQEALEQLVDDFIEFIPRLLAATIVLIIGNIVGALAEAGVERSLGHVSAELRQRVPPIIKWTIQGFVLVIAANQLGIDTTIISVVVAAVFFGLALAAALLAGLGGRDVARQVAAGRALRRELKVGDSISLGEVHGEIKAIGSTSTQITSHSDIVFVPNNEILQSTVEIFHAAPPDDPDSD